MSRVCYLSRSLILMSCLIWLGLIPRIASAQTGCVAHAGGVVASCAASSLILHPMRAADFVDTLGANGAPVTQVQAVGRLKQYQYVGLRRIRWSAGSGNTYIAPEVYATFCRAGIHIDMVANWAPYTKGGPQAVANALLSYLKAINSLAPGCVDTIEGINEPDINPALGQAYTQRAAVGDAVSVAMWNTIKPLYPNVKIATWGPGGSWDDGAGKFKRSNTTAFADYCNMHDYYESYWNSGNTFFGGDNPGSLPTFLSCQRDVVTNKQSVSTEFGWSMDALSSGNNWVNAPTQAKMIVSKFLDHAQLGMPESYVYDIATYSLGNDYGIYDINGNARDSAIVLHNLTALLSDNHASAATFAPATITINPSNMLEGLATLADGNNPTGHFLLLQKSDGSSWLLLWNEADAWHYQTKSEIIVKPAVVTLNLPGPVSGNIYDPFGCKETQWSCNPAAGTIPVTGFKNVDQIPVTLTDHLILVEISKWAQASQNP